MRFKSINRAVPIGIFLKFSAFFGLVFFIALPGIPVTAGFSNSPGSKLLPLESITAGNFGSSAVMSGNIALVGADTKDSGAGGIYVFELDDSAWKQQTIIKGSDTGPGDHFGLSMDISGDTIVVGAATKTVDVGAVYVFVRNGNLWTEQAKLLGSDAVSGALFGSSVAISGDTVAIGARGSNSVYVFTRNGTAWEQQQKITVADSVSGDGFGSSVDIDSGTIVIGVPGLEKTFVFSLSGDAWVQQAELNPDEIGTSFGSSVAISGDSVVVGADTTGNSGAAYIYSRNGTVWSRQAKLTSNGFGEHFGDLVSIDGNRVAVSAFGTGKSYLFRRSGTAWAQEASIEVNDYSLTDATGWSLSLEGNYVLNGMYRRSNSSGAAYVFAYDGNSWELESKLTAIEKSTSFGQVVAVNGNYAAVSAAGAVYLYSRSAGVWIQQSKLTYEDSDKPAGYGSSMAVDGYTLAVGAPGDANERGAVYVFARSGPNWLPQAKLVAKDTDNGDSFGDVVAIRGDTLLVGAPSLNRVYVFSRIGTTWGRQAVLTTSDTQMSGEFGSAVAVNGNTAVVGAHASSVNSGAAYIFTRSLAAWTQQSRIVVPGSFSENISIAMSGDTILIGSPGSASAYVFVASGISWSQQAVLVPGNGIPADEFGISVALNGDTALVGAAGRSSAFVFERNGSEWNQQSVLAETGQVPSYGMAVAIGSDSAIVGASGTAYIYENVISPSVATAGVSAVTAQDGKLYGSLVSMGTASNVNVYFEYGVSTAYGSKTEAQLLNAPGVFAAEIPGLKPGTDYHFRAVAETENGLVSRGDDMIISTLSLPSSTLPPQVVTTTVYPSVTTTVTTKPPSPSVTNQPTTTLPATTTPPPSTTSPAVLSVATEAAGEVLVSSATMVGRLQSLGSAANVNVYFEYGPTASYGSTTPVQQTSQTGEFTAKVSGLSPGTEFHYRARVDGGAAGWAVGQDIVFKTQGQSSPAIWIIGGIGLLIILGLAGVLISRRRASSAPFRPASGIQMERSSVIPIADEAMQPAAVNQASHEEDDKELEELEMLRRQHKISDPEYVIKKSEIFKKQMKKNRNKEQQI